MFNLVMVMTGGAGGAALRYGIALALGARAFPWATLAVNLLGGLAMGLLMARLPGEPWRLLLGVGLLGGFTTFSAFGLDTVRLIEGRQTVAAVAYVVASVVGAVALTAAGLRLR